MILLIMTLIFKILRPYLSQSKSLEFPIKNCLQAVFQARVQRERLKELVLMLFFLFLSHNLFFLGFLLGRQASQELAIENSSSSLEKELQVEGESINILVICCSGKVVLKIIIKNHNKWRLQNAIKRGRIGQDSKDGGRTTSLWCGLHKEQREEWWREVYFGNRLDSISLDEILLFYIFRPANILRSRAGRIQCEGSQFLMKVLGVSCPLRLQKQTRIIQVNGYEIYKEIRTIDHSNIIKIW